MYSRFQVSWGNTLSSDLDGARLCGRQVSQKAGGALLAYMIIEQWMFENIVENYGKLVVTFLFSTWWIDAA